MIWKERPRLKKARDIVMTTALGRGKRRGETEDCCVASETCRALCNKGWSVTLVCNLRRASVAANHVVGLGDELGRPPTPPDTPPLVA